MTNQGVAWGEAGVRVIGEAFLNHLLRLGDLPPEDCRAVVELDGEVRTLRRHEDVIKAGETPSSSFVVMRGFLQRYTSRRDGSRQIHSFYIPTDAPSLESLHAGRVDNNLCAVVSSQVAVIRHSELEELMRAHPNVGKLILRSISVQASIYREWLMRNSRMPADASMAHLFCEMYARCKAAGIGNGDSCDVPLTQDMLAEALGLTAVHVNRTLQQLRETGMVDHKSGILLVNDFKRLASYADFDPAYLHLKNGHG
jgi:CRP-like cAMP-binding protein